MSSNIKEVVTQALDTILPVDGRISAADLYEKVKGDLEAPVPELNDFRIWVKSFCNNSGKYESVRGRFGGIRFLNAERVRAPSNTVAAGEGGATDDEEEEEEDFSNSATVMINPRCRVYAVDKRNWAIQNLSGTSGELWLSAAYYPTLQGALRGVARLVLKKQLKLTLDKVTQLNQLATVLDGMESKLEERLNEIVVVQPSSRKESLTPPSNEEAA